MRVDSAIFDPWLQISNFLLPRFSTVGSILHFCPPQRIRYPNIVLLYLHKYLNHAQDPQHKMGPLQLAIHVLQNRRAGEQKSQWDKTNKENYNFRLCMSLACLVPVRLLLSSMAVLHHVNG